MLRFDPELFPLFNDAPFGFGVSQFPDMPVSSRLSIGIIGQELRLQSIASGC